MAAVRRVKGIWGVETAEAWAGFFGLRLARRFGFSKVWLESDSMGIVNKISNAERGFSYLFLFLDDILSLKSLFSEFRVSHVRRGGNCLAHYVARQYADWGVERVWCEPIPQDICNVAIHDLI